MPSVDVSEPPSVQCQVAADRTEGMVTISGIVSASKTIDGTYKLQILKQGPAGSSRLQQGGNFSAQPSTDARTSQARVSLEPGARLTAVLTVTAGGQVYECQAEL